MAKGKGKGKGKGLMGNKAKRGTTPMGGMGKKTPRAPKLGGGQ